MLAAELTFSTGVLDVPSFSKFNACNVKTVVVGAQEFVRKSKMDRDIQELISLIASKQIEFLSEFEDYLTECGYMIVPIEDPTNLRFGVDD